LGRHDAVNRSGRWLPIHEGELLEPDKLLSSVRDAMTVSRVFGEAYERDGVTVIPAAVVRGGGGGGGGRNRDTGNRGQGGGFGLIARPAGAYVITDGAVRWEPAVDVNRIVTAGVVGGVVATWLLTRRPRRGRSPRRALS